MLRRVRVGQGPTIPDNHTAREHHPQRSERPQKQHNTSNTTHNSRAITPLRGAGG